MLKDITHVTPLPNYGLQLTFEDGLEGTITLTDLLELEGVFAPLQDVAYFEQVGVDPELGTVCWPNGADLDADVLYSLVSGVPIILEPETIFA